VSSAEYNIYEIIDRVRGRPGMFISPISTDALSTFLCGYSVAMVEAGRCDVAKPRFQGFHDWVQEKFSYGESTAGWSNMILAKELGLSPDDSWEEFLKLPITQQQHAAALQSFFCLLDEYRKQVRKP
jgi:hypothetical protein